MELCKAILNGNVRQLAQLCKEGRNVSKRTGRLGVMPLHVACAVGNVDAVRVLLGNPTVLPTAVDQAHNRTPLHWALANGHFECASLLVQRGVADEALDKEQRSAYDLFRQRLHDAGLLAAAAVVSELWTWGNGASHQLGHGTTEQVRLPKKVKSLPPSSPVAAAAISSFTGFAATEGGTVWSWGSQRARLGQTEGEDVQPRPCPVRALRGKRVVHLAASAQHALAVTDAGHVYSWGLGKDGKLGHDSEESVATPRRVTGGGLERAFCVSAAASDVHSCVLTSQGDLYTFGFGGDGQLGHSSYLSALKPKLVTSIGQVVCVAASRTHTAVVVSSRKEVYIFGCHFATPVKRHIPKEEVVHCAAVARGTLFATRSGNIYQADATEIAVPVQINGIPRRIRQISGCDETFAAVDHNGIIYVWSYARVTTGTAKVKADVYTDLRGRMPHVVAAKNSYAAIVHTPQIAPAAAAAPAQLAEHLSALLPPALLRELALAPPAPAATPGDVRLAFCHDGAPAAAPVLALAAHKFLLHARCPALRPALHADALAVPVPPDVPRAALAALVYYVYTGRAAPLAHAAPPPDALRVLARRLGLRHLDADLAAERAASPAPLADEDDEGELPAPRAQQPPPRATLAADFAAALEPEGFPHADMAVHLQGAAVRVNRALLDARSDYFRTLMHVGMAEARSGDIHLGSEDLTLPSLRTLIHYFYTDELRVEDTADDVTALMEVIVAANEMLADGLKQRAESALMCHLTLSNVAQFTLFAEHYEATNLLECCTTYLARHVYLVPSVLASFPPSVLRRMQQSLAGSLPPEALLAQLRESAGADATSPKKRSSLEAKEEGAEAEAEAVDATETAGAAEAEAEAEVEAEAEAGTAEEEALSEASGAAAEAVVRADGDGGRELAAPAPASPWKAQAAAQPSLAAIQRQEQMESAARRKPAAAGPAKAPGEAEAAAEREEGRAPALSAKKKRMPLAAFLKPEAAPRPSLHAPAPWAAAAKPAAAAVSLVEVQQREAAANERRAASEKAALRSSAPSAQEHAGAKLSQSGGRADFPPLRNSTPAMAVASAPRAEAEAEAASPARRTLVEIQEEERRRASEVARMKAPPRVDLKAVQEEERRQKKEQDDMRTLRALGFTEEEARNGLEMFLGDVQQVVANLLYVVDERNAAATAAALATSPPKGGGRGRRGGGGGRGRRGQHAP